MAWSNQDEQKKGVACGVPLILRFSSLDESRNDLNSTTGYKLDGLTPQADFAVRTHR
ncbi:hypothetical protein DAPPUDRAFT_234082 [Daphnia pulex]|uniref:Uncharacterized protein n=1 Tax=Daphnia pulex TaxID=6669 RepID=E9FUI7_DAPPU|nr:hypothetical protein DAPPUDRAFT_234082 [Daphnia pulex]|eukprot:EFX88917.1 hypothetical protein DAPPUDRAFT_234082 [Daphnia pulex]